MDCCYAARVHLFQGEVYSKLYGKFRWGGVLNERGTTNEGHLGSVFNLEFSPHGDFVVSVRSGRAFVVHDPRLCRRLHCQYSAHDDCVNCITFINNHLFATCSDDCTIRLWDFRNLHSTLGVLRGHSNWVKNIEYDSASGKLFSIAFQDGVRHWDIDNLEAYSDEEERDNLIATLPEPVRMRLSPDGTKMFITSRRSQCQIISDFDGKHLLDVQELHRNFLEDPQLPATQETLRLLTANRPSLQTLCGSRGGQTYRIVMSAAFHPSGQFVAMRHTDVSKDRTHQELTSLYDLREDHYAPLVGAQEAQHKYLRYVDDNSPEDSADFIKEICFSRDGRILASPYENGVRLFTIDSSCTAADIYFDKRYYSLHKADCCPDLEEVVCIPNAHLSPVLTCKFARHDLMLAMGSLAGSTTFSKPQI